MGYRSSFYNPFFWYNMGNKRHSITHGLELKLMAWNWQREDWPEFQWYGPRLRRAEDEFLVRAGRLQGIAQRLRLIEYDEMLAQILSEEAVSSSRIEGEAVLPEGVLKSIRCQLGLEQGDDDSGPSERGVSEMAVAARKDFAAPLTDQILWSWHTSLLGAVQKTLPKRLQIEDIGRYRTHPEPMQVVSNRTGKPRVYFEAPPSVRVPPEMARFLDWFNRTSAGEPAVTRAALAHLYFVSIHPFEDGNGRIGRAVAEKTLLQALGRDTLLCLSPAILARRSDYYSALQASQSSVEVSGWVAWFAGIVLEALHRTEAQILFILDKAEMLERLAGQLNGRQEKALLRMFEAGTEGFLGGMSADKYFKITHAPHSTVTRDLNDLVDKKALWRSGQRRQARYHLSLTLRPTPLVTVDEQGLVLERAPAPLRADGSDVFASNIFASNISDANICDADNTLTDSVKSML